jgi:hypothetical protein
MRAPNGSYGARVLAWSVTRYRRSIRGALATIRGGGYLRFSGSATDAGPVASRAHGRESRSPRKVRGVVPQPPPTTVDSHPPFRRSASVSVRDAATVLLPPTVLKTVVRKHQG